MKKFSVLALFVCFALLRTSSARAEEWTPQHFSLEFKPGFFLPTGDSFEQFFDDCCNIIYPIHFGFLHQSKYNIDLGVGFFTREGNAVGSQSGAVSGDTFRLTLVPVSTNFTFRADFKENQIAVPYAGLGLDYVYARENFQGAVTEFWKFGYHFHAGVQLLAEWFEDDSDLEASVGINDLYLIFEGKYARIDDFGGDGLDLSGWIFSTGFLLEF